MSGILAIIRGNQYITEILGACILFILPHRKREFFWPRVISFCVLVETVSLFIMNSAWAKAIWQSTANVVASCIIFIMVFSLVSAMFIAFCCPASWKELVYCVALSLCIQHFSSAFQLLLLGLVPGSGLAYDFIIEFITVPVIYFVFYRFSIRRICENGVYQLDNLRLTAATCLIFLVAAFTSVAVKGAYPEGDRPLFLFCQIYEMLCCFFLMWIQVNQKQALDYQHELDMQSYVQHMGYEQLENSRQNRDLLTHLMHDLKHQIAGMLVPQSDAQRDDLLQQIEQNLMLYDGEYWMKNEALNTALVERSLYCREHHIQIMCVADCESLQFVKTGDLYLLLRNGLDNAIEGVCQLENPERRVVDLKVYRWERVLMIQIQNPYTGRLVFRNGLPRTTKADSRFHGYGLKLIRQIAKKYGGEMTVNADHQTFSLRVILPIPDGNDA